MLAVAVFAVSEVVVLVMIWLFYWAEIMEEHLVTLITLGLDFIQFGLKQNHTNGTPHPPGRRLVTLCVRNIITAILSLSQLEI